MPGLLLLPVLLAGAASAAWGFGPGGPSGRRLALGAALAAAALAGLAPSGAWEWPWLLLGARAGLDTSGRAALLLAAVLVLPPRRRGGASLAGAAPAWRALLAAGLCAAAVALDAGVLALGLVAQLFATYGLAVRGPEGRRAAAWFMAAAVAGEVLLVDALAEFGHAAESAHLDAMRVAAAGALGPSAPLLLAAAFGLPVLSAGVARLWWPAAVLAATGALTLSRLVGAPAEPRADAAALALLGLAALAGAGGLLGRTARARWPWWPWWPAQAGPGAPAAAAPDAGPARASAGPPAGAAPEGGPDWPGAAEAWLRDAGAILLLLSMAALGLRFALQG